MRLTPRASRRRVAFEASELQTKVNSSTHHHIPSPTTQPPLHYFESSYQPTTSTPTHKTSPHNQPWYTPTPQPQTNRPIANSLSQTSIGTGYDLSNSVFSPDGRNFQVEYAVKAVENGGTAVGIRCQDGVVLALEKLVTSKLLKKDANRRIAAVDRNAGIAHSGLLPDARHFSARAR